jgi:hypothetical protein
MIAVLTMDGPGDPESAATIHAGDRIDLGARTRRVVIVGDIDQDARDFPKVDWLSWTIWACGIRRRTELVSR